MLFHTDSCLSGLEYIPGLQYWGSDLIAYV